MMIQFVRPMMPIQFEMQFAPRILAQLSQLIFESNSPYVHELFLLWQQERMVNIVEAIDMEGSVPRADIMYLKNEKKIT